MAKKHASNAGFLIPDVYSQAPPPPPRDLPFNIGTLLLPRLIREIADGQHINREHQAQARAVFRNWIDHLNAGKLNALNEGQVEADFTGKLFAALGYKTQLDVVSGPFSMIPKWPVGHAGTADVALGEFRVDETGNTVGMPKVVVELKGVTANLDKRVGGRTPVEQAWVYLNACETADWAIVSNFAEIRLYHRKGSNYVHRVRLIDLADADRFAEFYAVFHAASLLGTGNFPQNTAWLLKRTEEKQEEVGEELYAEYRDRRQELIRELTAKGYDFASSVAAAQKLLDRILFIAFAEDRGLLDNTGKILESTASLRIFRHSKWNNFQFLFAAIDEGDPPHDIPQYNGELFKADEILDNIDFQLDDKWPTVFTGIGSYDFKDEVTEAVLGRIFELSIDDIEKLKQEGLPPAPDVETAIDQKRPGRRKLQGVFYTHASIVDYLVSAALQPAFDAEKTRLAAVHALNPDEPSAPFVKAMIAWLDTRTVCDPSCGSGAFLSRAYNWFEDRRLQLLTQLHDLDPADPLCAGHPNDWRARSAQSILSHNLYGVDLSGESVEIARLSLWIRTARRDQKLTNLAENVMQGNSVVDDPAVDPLAFDWKTRFARVFENGGFDAIIGNPPYVRHHHVIPIKDYLKQFYKSYHGLADLYVYFYERGFNILKNGGRLAFIVTNKWMKSNYGESLRNLFSTEAWIESVVDFGHAKQFFRDADVFPCFFVVQKPIDGQPQPGTTISMIKTEKLSLDAVIAEIPVSLQIVSAQRFGSDPWSLEPQELISVAKKIVENSVKLEDYAGLRPLIGIMTGYNEAYLIDSETKERLFSSDPNLASVVRPYVRGQDLARWKANWNGLWMIAMASSDDFAWPWSSEASETEAESIFKRTYPGLYAHFKRHEPNLRARYPENQGKFWWEVRTCQYWDKFDQPKIFYQDITWKLSFCLDSEGTLSNSTIYFLPTSDPWLLAVLNSSASWWYAYRTAQHGKDEALRYFTTFVRELPIPSCPTHQKDVVSSVTMSLAEIASSKQRTTAEMLDWLKVEFDIPDPNTKLQNPIALSSDDFIAEVKKARGKKKGLTSPQTKALRDEYIRSIDPARILAAEAKGLELQIHDLVNEAYGLTPEEVRLMWDTAPPRMPIERPPGI